MTQQADKPNDIGRNCLLGNRKKMAKFLMRTFICRSTFLYGSRFVVAQPGRTCLLVPLARLEPRLGAAPIPVRALPQFQSLQGVNQLDFVPPPTTLSFAMRPATSVLLNLYLSRSRGLSLACRGRHLSPGPRPISIICHLPDPLYFSYPLP